MTTAEELTVDMLADLEAPHEVRISPSGTQVIYTLRADWNRPRNRWLSSLWIADVGKEHSARQLTSGDSKDSWAKWHPDGKSIAFLSDNAKEGVDAIWTLSFDGATAAKPVPLTSTEKDQSITQFAWSADGKYIAYLSADEKTAERKAREKSKDDAKVYGENVDYGRLRIIDVATKKTITLISQSRHVFDLAWSPDAKRIAFATMEKAEYEIQWVSGTDLEVVQLDDQSVSKLVHIAGAVQDLSWIKDDLWWRAFYTMDKAKSSSVVYTMPVATQKYRRYGYGEHNCATPWGWPPGLVQASPETLAVQIQEGLQDQIHILPEGKVVYDEQQEVRTFHAVETSGKTVVVLVTSSADKPFEAYSIVDGELVCLSDHGKDVTGLDLGTAEAFYTKAQDGTDLDAVLVTPKNYNESQPLPTVVLVHGGPYGRVSRSFDVTYFYWSPWLLAAGYAVLSPNYRGGSSHGEKFAAGVRGRAGELDYSDTVDLVKAAVDAKIIDPNRVAIAGWSYGGYLSYLAVARDSTFHFQAAVCGAGLSDWDHTIMTSSGWRSAVEIAGSGPWIGGVNNIHNRKGSAIWNMEGARTPVLMLHGEDDDIVPIAQAQGFHHGCVHRGIPAELIIYPREGHGMAPPFERAHYVDMLKRIRRFFDQHLKADKSMGLVGSSSA